MDYRTSASFGKRQEYVAMAELLRRGFDVYQTLVDDQQIDCVIRREKDGELSYLDIQIKARSKLAKNSGTFSAMEIRNPRENFYFIFYAELIDTYWIFPSLELIDLANVVKSGKNEGKFRIVLVNYNISGVKPRPIFKPYQNAFEILDNPV